MRRSRADMEASRGVSILGGGKKQFASEEGAHRPSAEDTGSVIPKPLDCDLARRHDPRYCVPYVEEFCEHIGKLEDVRRPPRPGFLERSHGRPKGKGPSRGVTHKMRAILIDWLVELAQEWKFHPVTLYITVHYLDRVLARMEVAVKQLQLVGCACMLLAAKYEEIYPPSVEDFVNVSDKTYTDSQVRDMELKCLEALDYHLNVATVMTFLPRNIRAAADEDCGKGNSTIQKHLAMYIADLSLVVRNNSATLSQTTRFKVLAVLLLPRLNR